MKYLLTLGVFVASLSVFAQHMPDNKSFGLKASYNFIFPSFVPTGNTVLFANANPGFGAGAYFRYDFSERVSFQPELIISSRSANFTSESVSEPTDDITITETYVSNISQVNVELPLYFKMRWELTALHKGHYKANKMIGVVVGPRIIFNASGKKETSSSEITRLYDQESAVFVESDQSGASDFFSPVTAGINVGVDFEVLSRLVLYANFYRGFISMNKSEQGFRSFDNRAELGVGIRLY